MSRDFASLATQSLAEACLQETLIWVVKCWKCYLFEEFSLCESSRVKILIFYSWEALLYFLSTLNSRMDRKAACVPLPTKEPVSLSNVSRAKTLSLTYL
jgi:hypothetical protein